MLTLIGIAAIGIGVGYAIKHYLTSAQLATLETTLKSFEEAAVVDGKAVIAFVRSHLGI